MRISQLLCCWRAGRTTSVMQMTQCPVRPLSYSTEYTRHLYQFSQAPLSRHHTELKFPPRVRKVIEDKRQTGQERETPNRWDENIHTWNSSVVLREYFRKKQTFLRRGDVTIRVGCYSNQFNSYPANVENRLSS
jgi:hypothetical protein